MSPCVSALSKADTHMTKLRHQSISQIMFNLGSCVYLVVALKFIQFTIISTDGKFLLNITNIIFYFTE